jgi:hypothetical protein
LHEFIDPAKDINGNFIGVYLSCRQHNISTVASSIFTYSGTKNTHIGMGLSANILLYSFQVSVGAVVIDYGLVRNYKYSP